MPEPFDAHTVRGLLRLALPLAVSTGLGFFLHYVNRTVLSWHSPEALAASLPAGMLAWTFQGLFIVSCGYLGVFAAQHTAAGERREAGAMVWPMFCLAALGLLVSAILIPLRHHLAGIFGTEPVVERGLAELLGWYLAEVGPMAAASGIAGFCGGIGRTRLVLALSVAGAAVCIALNRWLVLGGLGLPALGVTGAGIASLVTSIAMLGMWLLWLFAPAQRRELETWSARNVDPARMRRFFSFALPRGATEILEMLAFVAFTAVLTRLGTDALSASNLAFNTYLLLMVPVVGFAQGISIAVGQAMGAGKPELARGVVRSAFTVIGPYMLLVAFAFITVPRLLLLPAHHGDDALWERQMLLAVPVMGFLAVAMPFEMMHWIWRSAVQGAGDTRWPLLFLVGVAVLVLAVPAWLLLPYMTPGIGGLRICYALFIAYLVGIALAMWLRYARGPWPTMSVRH
jgi:multidrug resistance protein, MATE family